ncbi:LysE family transporter [Pinirhizobacter sp.]|uniref:LysE family transporter n=1 Tax=Pinirhizobacter sp. TaxID=2950432 RepID=UPI0031F2DAFF
MSGGKARRGSGTTLIIGAMTLFLTIAFVQLLALMSPGPDFFFVSQMAISRSRREAMAGVAGIALGVVVWAALALLGLQILLHRLAWLGRLLAVAGGLYLCWMGVQMIRGALKPAGPSHAVALESNSRAALRRGFLTNLANPKAAIYFASIFSAIVGNSVGAGTRWGLLVLVSVETFVWFAVVAAIFGLPAIRRGYLRARRWIDGAAGAVFIAFGLTLVFDRRLS